MPQIFETGEYRKYSRTIEGYAYRFASIPESTTRKALNLHKYIQNKPRLQNLVKEVGVHKMSAVATILNEENEDVLIEKLKSLSLAAINQLAKETRGSNKIIKITFNLSEAQYKVFNLAMKQLGPSDEPESILEKLCCNFLRNDKSNEKIESSVHSNSRYIPQKVKKKVLTKYNNLCAYPGCSKKFKAIHHQEYFAKTHAHNPDKLVTLCKEHHEFMHNNLVVNSDLDPIYWRLEPNLTIDKHDLKYLKMRT